MREISEIAIEVLAELQEIFPYLLIGVTIEAFVRTMKWHVKIRNALHRWGIFSIIAATLVGLVSPLCACGILPLVISLILSGLPLAPAMSLLVTSPLMSPAGYTLAVKNLGPQMANLEVAAAIFMGLFAGFVVHIFELRGLDVRKLFKKELPRGNFHDPDYPEEILRCACDEMFSKKIERQGHGPALVFLAKMWEGGIKVGKYLLLGIIMQVIALRYVPNEFIDALLTSGNPLSVIILPVLAIPLHITQITASAILFGFADKGVNPSSALALLIGGPVTAIPAMSMFLTFFRPALFFLYIGVCVVGTLIVSFLFPLFLR